MFGLLKKIKSKVSNFLDPNKIKHISFIGEELFLPPREDDLLKRFKQIIFLQSSYLTVFFLLAVSAYGYYIGLKISPIVSLGAIFINILLLFYLKFEGKIYVISSIHIFLLWMFITFLLLETGGANSNMIIWYIIVITLAFEYIDDRLGVGIWLIIVFLSVIALYILTGEEFLFKRVNLQENYEIIFQVFFMIFYTSILFVYISEKSLYQKEIIVKKTDLETKAQELTLSLEEIQRQNEQIKLLNDKLEDKQLLIENQVSVLKNLVKSRADVIQKLAIKNKQIKQYIQDINDSLKYAEILQRLLLTDEKVLNKYFSTYFLIHEQKQHVGGDFYYIKDLEENKILLALGDATGHGPAGAILASIAIQFLNDICNNGNIQPSFILTKLRDKILRHFAFFTLEEKFYFGIEVLAIVYDKQYKTLLVSSLGMPVIIVKGDILLEFLPFNRSIMNHLFMDPVNQIKIQLSIRDKIYLFSDGYYSQLNENYKKLKRETFRKLLEELASQPMFTQKQILEYQLKLWRGEQELTDDITVLGLEI